MSLYRAVLGSRANPVYIQEIRFLAEDEFEAGEVVADNFPSLFMEIITIEIIHP